MSETLQQKTDDQDTNSDPAPDDLGQLARDSQDAAQEPAVDALPSTGLLSFYNRLRERIARTLEQRAGKLGGRAAEALLLVPDVFFLLLRLSLDKEVPKATRATLASTLAYFVLPIDLMPEALLGPVGYLDDLVLALTALSQAFGKELEPYAEKYWSGAQPLRTVIGDITHAASSLLGNNTYERLRQRLAKQGIELEAEDEP